jgi:SAM-dependent methyltransferase
MALRALTKFRDALTGRGAKAGAGNAAPDMSSSAPRDRFSAAAASLGADARVLEIGTKQSIEGRATHAMQLFPQVPRSNYLMADVEAGADVDVIADLHALPQDWANRFNAVMAVAVFEHLERPWIAAREVARVLVPGGFCYISTHQTFPLHGYPSDFFRFSKEALALIFRDAGMHVSECAYEHRAKITAPNEFIALSYQDEWNATFPSYMVVNLFAEKGA